MRSAPRGEAGDLTVLAAEVRGPGANVKHDWPVILQQLSERGFTAYKVATILNVRWDSVKSWMQGSEPKYSCGERLLELYRDIVPDETTEKR